MSRSHEVPIQQGQMGPIWLKGEQKCGPLLCLPTLVDLPDNSRASRATAQAAGLWAVEPMWTNTGGATMETSWGPRFLTTLKPLKPLGLAGLGPFISWSFSSDGAPDPHWLDIVVSSCFCFPIILLLELQIRKQRSSFHCYPLPSASADSFFFFLKP